MTSIELPQYQGFDEQEAVWRGELSDLSALIAQVEERFAAGDKVTLEGFKSLYSQTRFLFTGLGLSFGSLSEYATRVLELMQKSRDVYSVQRTKPSNTKGDYVRLGNTLHPREIRLLVKGEGLTGHIVPQSELATQEGLSKSNAPYNIIKNAKRSLTIALAAQRGH